MIDLFQNPFSGFNFQSTRQATGIVDKSIIRTGVQSSSLIASSWDIVDEYIPSSSTSSSTYKPSSGHAVPLVDEESVQSGVVTDKMREEMKSGDSYWTAMGLLPVATPIFNEIFNRALEEKGIDPVDFNQGYCSGFTINPDGIFMFAPDESGSKVDPSYAKEVCLALESAFNSSSLNMNENPHLFTKDFLPPDYEPEKWGRTVNREEWSVDREPDFSMFVEELRSDIVKEFESLNIVDFSMKINDQGKLTITDVQTEGNDPKANSRAMERMNSGLTDEINKQAEYFGLLALSGHHARNGDVLLEGILEPFDGGSKGDIEQFKHEVILTSGKNYMVRKSGD